MRGESEGPRNCGTVDLQSIPSNSPGQEKRGRVEYSPPPSFLTHPGDDEIGAAAPVMTVREVGGDGGVHARGRVQLAVHRVRHPRGGENKRARRRLQGGAACRGRTRGGRRGGRRVIHLAGESAGGEFPPFHSRGVGATEGVDAGERSRSPRDPTGRTSSRDRATLAASGAKFLETLEFFFQRFVGPNFRRRLPPPNYLHHLGLSPASMASRPADASRAGV